METDINEFIDKLEKYFELEEKIKMIRDPRVLKENENYRAWINLEFELKNYVLNDGKIIEIYNHVKRNAEEKYLGDISYLNTELKNIGEEKSALENKLKKSDNFIADLKKLLNFEEIVSISKKYSQY